MDRVKKIILMVVLVGVLFIPFPAFGSSPSPSPSPSPTPTLPTPPEQSADCVLTSKDAWNNKFPFGLVLGTLNGVDPFSECVQVELFGYTYPVCALGTLVDILKNVVLVKLIIQSIINL